MGKKGQRTESVIAPEASKEQLLNTKKVEFLTYLGFLHRSLEKNGMDSRSLYVLRKNLIRKAEEAREIFGDRNDVLSEAAYDVWVKIGELEEAFAKKTSSGGADHSDSEKAQNSVASESAENRPRSEKKHTEPQNKITDIATSSEEINPAKVLTESHSDQATKSETPADIAGTDSISREQGVQADEKLDLTSPDQDAKRAKSADPKILPVEEIPTSEKTFLRSDKDSDRDGKMSANGTNPKRKNGNKKFEDKEDQVFARAEAAETRLRGYLAFIRELADRDGAYKKFLDLRADLALDPRQHWDLSADLMRVIEDPDATEPRVMKSELAGGAGESGTDTIAVPTRINKLFEISSMADAVTADLTDFRAGEDAALKRAEYALDLLGDQIQRLKADRSGESEKFSESSLPADGESTVSGSAGPSMETAPDKREFTEDSEMIRLLLSRGEKALYELHKNNPGFQEINAAIERLKNENPRLEAVRPLIYLESDVLADRPELYYESPINSPSHNGEQMVEPKIAVPPVLYAAYLLEYRIQNLMYLAESGRDVVNPSAVANLKTVLDEYESNKSRFFQSVRPEMPEIRDLNDPIIETLKSCGYIVEPQEEVYYRRLLKVNSDSDAFSGGDATDKISQTLQVDPDTARIIEEEMSHQRESSSNSVIEDDSGRGPQTSSQDAVTPKTENPVSGDIESGRDKRINALLQRLAEESGNRPAIELPELQAARGEIEPKIRERAQVYLDLFGSAYDESSFDALTPKQIVSILSVAAYSAYPPPVEHDLRKQAPPERYVSEQAPPERYVSEQAPPERYVSEQAPPPLEVLENLVDQESARPLDAQSLADLEARLAGARTRFAQAEQRLRDQSQLSKVYEKIFSGKYDQSRQDAYNAAKAEYKGLRAEYLGLAVEKFVDERIKLLEKRLEAAAGARKESTGSRLYDWYKKLGRLNLNLLLEKTGVFDDSVSGGSGPTALNLGRPSQELKVSGIKKFFIDNKAGKFLGTAVNVRTVASFGLLGVGVAAGATSVGLGALAMRRVIGMAGSGVGAFDISNLISAKLDRRSLQRELDEARNNGRQLSPRMVEDRMAALEAKALANGCKLTELAGDPLYAELERMRSNYDYQHLERIRAITDIDERGHQVEKILDSGNARLRAFADKEKRSNIYRKALGAAVGATVGSGAVWELFAKKAGQVAEAHMSGDAKFETADNPAPGTNPAERNPAAGAASVPEAQNTSLPAAGEILHNNQPTGARFERVADVLNVDPGRRGIEGAFLDLAGARPHEYQRALTWLHDRYDVPVENGNTPDKLIHRFVLDYAKHNQIDPDSLNNISAGRIAIASDGSLRLSGIETVAVSKGPEISATGVEASISDGMETVEVEGDIPEPEKNIPARQIREPSGGGWRTATAEDLADQSGDNGSKPWHFDRTEGQTVGRSENSGGWREATISDLMDKTEDASADNSGGEKVPSEGRGAEIQQADTRSVSAALTEILGKDDTMKFLEQEARVRPETLERVQYMNLDKFLKTFGRNGESVREAFFPIGRSRIPSGEERGLAEFLKKSAEIYKWKKDYLKGISVREAILELARNRLRFNVLAA